MSATKESEQHLETLCDRITRAAEGKDRLIVAIAGAPASGKSTLSARLCQRLNAEASEGDIAAVVPMDGFHLDDGVLREQGTLARKGAPFTFDFGGLNAILSRLKTNREDAIAVPLFDRDLEIARAGARLIPRSCKIILVEGNYLLLDLAPWSGLKQYFDLSVALSVPFPTLEKRLIARWTGLGFSPDEAFRRARENDLANASLVQEKGLDATLVIEAEDP